MSTKKPREGTYRLNLSVIRKFLDAKQKQPKWLASLAGVDRRTFDKWLRGAPVRLSNVIALAKAMNVGMQTICIDALPEHANALETPGITAPQTEDWTFTLPAESMSTWSDEKRAAFCEGIRLIISVGGRIHIVKEAEGSMKITVRLTPEQAAALLRAHGEGKLAALGISEMVKEPAPVPPPAPPAPAPRPPVWKRIKTSHISMALSFACSLSGVFPIEALPAYFLGILSGLVSLVLRWRVPRGWWIPAALIMLNSVAAAAWPNAIGVFRDPDGYHFRADERVRYGTVRFEIDQRLPEDGVYRLYTYEPVLDESGSPITGQTTYLRFKGTAPQTIRLKSGYHKGYLVDSPTYLNVGQFVAIRSNIPVSGMPYQFYVWPDAYGTTVIQVKAQPDMKTEHLIRREP